MGEHASEVTVQVSTTEMEHFRRLVQFLEDADRHADETCDVELQRLVRECRDDLLHLA